MTLRRAGGFLIQGPVYSRRMLAAPGVGGYSGARVVAGDAGPGRRMARCGIGFKISRMLAAPAVGGYSWGRHA
jgi:hypothetical protein